MYFANPWGLLALAALPAILVIHMYHRRFPPLVVAGAHLWSTETLQNLAGRKRERLPVTATLILELLAALFLSLVLARPQFGGTDRREHLVAVIDNSASMSAGTGNAAGQSFQAGVAAELDRRVQELPRGSVVTLILTGPRPAMLAGPAVPWNEAKESLSHWSPNLPRHSFEPAWDLGLQLVESSGRLLFLTDHLPSEKDVPAKMEAVSVGRRLENVAINAARWIFDSAAGKGRIFVRVQNLGRTAAHAEVRGRRGDEIVFRKAMTLAAQSAAAFETEVPGGLGQLRIKISAAGDGLTLDNHVDLIEPEVRTITAAVALPKGEASRLVRKVFDVLPNVQYGDVASANLVIAPAGTLPESNPRLWWLGIGPLSSDQEATDSAKDLAGPYLLDKRSTLLDGIVLGGVVWGGVQPLKLDVTPLISSGNSVLFGRLNGTRTTAHLMNIDLARSNLGESPDWPILLTNLIELRRENLPGLQRWNYRLGEDVRFRLFEGEIDPGGADAPRLNLVHAEKPREIARSGQVELASIDEAGIYEIKDGEKLVGRFAVNFFDAEESNLSALVPGKLAARTEETMSEIAADNPYSWPIMLGIVAIVGLVIADWYALRPGQATGFNHE